MDHIPVPRQACLPPVEVPCLATPSIDKGSWRTYPSRHGWQVNEIREGTLILRNGSKPSGIELAAFCQAWLYFELLQDILGDLFDINQFVHFKPDSSRCVSTRNLEALLGQWTSRLTQNLNILETKHDLDKLYELSVEHRTVSLRLHIGGTSLGEASIMLSIAMLGERLQSAISDMYAHLKLKTPVEQTSRLRSVDFVDVGQPILDAMRARGWCPYDLKRLSAHVKHVSLLYYYSNLTPPRSTRDHSKCSDDQCLAMTTNPLTYKLSHRQNDCSCPLLSVDQKAVAWILEQGSIPVVTIDLGANPDLPRVAIHDIAKVQNFVAVSHVWAEGAGNVEDNALHSCLLKNISDLVKKIVPDTGDGIIPFWIDTLCVPVHPPHLQRLALNNMRIPYERAESVLVLDSHLRALDTSPLSTTELLAQVSCSSWMRRLWTLQEGRLAKTVWFQFANEAVDVKSIIDKVDWRRVPSTAGLWLQAELYAQLWVQIWYRGDRIKDTGAIAGSIASTRLAINSRYVSVSTDEGLCLFTLMDLDMRRITAVRPEQRMEVFWRTFEDSKVPLGFLFSKVAHKMPQIGIHWAPSSFLGLQSEKEWSGPQELSSPREEDPHAIPTSLGLRVALSGLLLHPGLVRRMRQFDFTWAFHLFVQTERGTWYAVRVEEPWRQDSDAPAPNDELAVILALGPQSEGYEIRRIGRSSSDFSFRYSTAGLLVSVLNNEEDSLVVKAHNHVVVEELGEGLQSYLSAAMRCAQDVNVPEETLSKESHSHSKRLYEKHARSLMHDSVTKEMLIGKARHVGAEDDYDALLDDLLDMIVVLARFGDRCKATMIPDSRQWCVD
ncbi:MAG: hypothetical protein Q9222_001000 [Ikaeria aurantiellina]